MSQLIDRLNKLRRQHYVNDDDCWYTCIAATDEADGNHSCNEQAPGDCDCGAGEFNKELDEIIKLVNIMINHNRELTAGIEW